MMIHDGKGFTNRRAEWERLTNKRKGSYGTNLKILCMEISFQIFSILSNFLLYETNKNFIMFCKLSFLYTKPLVSRGATVFKITFLAKINGFCTTLIMLSIFKFLKIVHIL